MLNLNSCGPRTCGQEALLVNGSFHTDCSAVRKQLSRPHRGNKDHTRQRTPEFSAPQVCFGQAPGVPAPWALHID